MTRLSLGLLVATVLALAATKARADERVIVLERRAPGTAPSPLVERTRTLLANSGIEIVGDDELRALLARPPETARGAVPEDLRPFLSSSAERAMEEVARGHDARARELVTAAFARVGNLLPVLVREVRPRRDLGDLCLFAVRASLDEHHDEDARAGVIECLRMFPDLSPPPDLHPPDVRDLVTSIRQEIATGNYTELVVTTLPVSRTDCPIFLNGTRVGQTPRIQMRLAPGRYVVTVECARQAPSRDYTVNVESARDPSTQQLVVLHPFLDETLRTEGDVHFEGDASTADRAISDAASIVQIVRARKLVLIQTTESGPTLTSVDGTYLPAGYMGERARFSTPHGSEDAEALRSTAVSTSASDSELAEILSSSGTPTQDSSRTYDAPVWAWAVGGIGAVGLLSDWILYRVHASNQHKLDVALPTDIDYADRVNRRNGSSTAVLWWGGISSTLLTGSLPFILPEREGVPWWSLALGGAGAALVATGIYFTAIDNSRLSDDQTHFERTVPLGPLLIMHGVPLLSIPLTYAIRSLFGPSTTQPSASLSVDTRAIGLSIQGSL